MALEVTLADVTVVYDPADPLSSSDPWAVYRRIRSEAPLHRSPRGFWVVARHVDCNNVLRDRRASSDSLNIDPDQMPEGLGGPEGGDALSEFESLQQSLTSMEHDNRPFLFRDPPDHSRLRGLVSKAFTPRLVEGLRARTEVMVDELIDEAFERGDVDGMADFAYPLPVRIICEMLGVPAADHERFKEWSQALSRGLDPDFLLPEEVKKARFDAILNFAAYFFELLADRRAHPGTDLLSELALAEDGGDTLSEGELLSTCILLLVAGHETTVNLIGGGLLALLEHPDQLARWRADPGLDRTATEELLRFVSPVQLTGRTLLEDIPVSDGVLPKGAFTFLLLGSANRDPDAFDRPEELDLARADNRHLGFGFGIHHCLGAPLARMEAQVALPALLRRCRGIELRTDHVTYRANVILRGLVELPVHLTPA
jgi:unspecific monooxygenase